MSVSKPIKPIDPRKKRVDAMLHGLMQQMRDCCTWEAVADRPEGSDHEKLVADASYDEICEVFERVEWLREKIIKLLSYADTVIDPITTKAADEQIEGWLKDAAVLVNSLSSKGIMDGKAGGIITPNLFLDEVQAKDLSITLIYKQDAALPDRLRFSAEGMTTQTKSIGELGLIDKRNGQPKRTVQMLVSLCEGKVAENVNAPQTFKELRNLLGRWGVQGKLFGKPKGGYRPYFKLRDGKDAENKNAIMHADYESGIDDVNDAAAKFLREHDG